MRNHVPSSAGAATLLVVGVDPRTMGVLREALGTDVAIPAQPVAYHDALAQARSLRPRVVIASFDADFDEAARIGPLLASELPGIQLVAISDRSDPDRIRSAMRSGYREYVVLPDDAELLRHAVHDAAYAVPQDEDQGEVVAVCGSKGGSGVTMIAVHLAAELCPVHRVVLVDLDFSMGDVAAYLDLRPSTSIADVLRQLHHLDERLLNGSVTVHPSGVHVLPQPTQIAESEVVHGDQVLQLLAACSRSYQYCVLDCGGRLEEATLTAITVADHVLLVTMPQVPALKNAWRRLQLFDRLGIERQRIRLVLNRWNRRASPVSLKDIERNLGIPVAATIQRDDRNVEAAIDAGSLLREFNRRSPAAAGISSLLDILTGTGQEPERQPRARIFQWLFT